MLNDHQQDNFEEGFERLRLATALLNKYKIAPSPINYWLAYAYVAGKSKALNTAIDQIVERTGELSGERLSDLYQQFIQLDTKALEKVRHELRQIILNVQSAFQYSGGNLSVYARTLNRFADILESTPFESIGIEVEKVLDDTRSMEHSQRCMEAEMSHVLTEIESLRTELAKIKEESMTDALTGISNRKAFDSALEHAILSSREQKSPLSILLIDIDHFKRFNDTYGHLTGDKVLRYVASTLKRCLKGRDMAARFGGEEFTAILPQTALAGAGVIAEQIRHAISLGALKNNRNGKNYENVTVSIGVAQFRENELPNDLIQRADKVLYVAKERGRNRVEKAI
ncbi:MAG: GGDEF domain-containing protein [Gammaproteobacteria bacterium]